MVFQMPKEVAPYADGIGGNEADLLRSRCVLEMLWMRERLYAFPWMLLRGIGGEEFMRVAV